MRSDGGPAFPTSYGDKGITVREYFAAKAMQGLLSCQEFSGKTVEWISEEAYAQADAMLARREKK